MKAKLLRLLELMEDDGSALRELYSKAFNNGIFELRCKVGSDISRVLYFFYVGNRIILTNGFIKKQQKTPVNEMKTLSNIELISCFRKNAKRRK